MEVGFIMAITSSAKKAIRSSARKKVFNSRRKKAIDNSLKKIKKLVATGQAEEAISVIPSIYKAIDKAAKANYLKKNTASRMKSRVVAFVRRNLK